MRTPTLTKWLATLGRTPVLAASLTIAVLLLVVGWLDYRANRRELLALVEARSIALQRTIGAAIQVNAAASALAQAQIAARVRDNARLLAVLDRQEPLDEVTIDRVVIQNDLFRVMLFEAGGGRVAAEGPSGLDLDDGKGAGLGRGPGFGQGWGAGQGPGAQLVARVLAGQEEAIGDVHSARRPGAGRLAVAIRRARGGAILVNADASAVLRLQEQTSLDALLREIMTSADDVAYIIVDVDDVRHTAGILPDDASSASGEFIEGRRERLIGDRPILEFSETIEETAVHQADVRIGMRLDDVRQMERRFSWRQATSFLAALLLGSLGLGLVWIRRAYGTLSEAHARAREALERRDRLAAMGELASTVAHEIRNPLNAIAMSAQRLQREAFGSEPVSAEGADESRALVDVIRREAERINTRVQQFVAFARPPEPQFVPVDLGPWLQTVVEALAPTASFQSVTMTVDVRRANEATIDADLLRQAVDNLVTNAIDATPPGGHVVVEAVSAREDHRIVVRDSGAGIADEARPRIFDLYFTTKPKGTGVGLAVTHQIVAAHGGRIDVDSAPGLGATFTIVLPLRT